MSSSSYPVRNILLLEGISNAAVEIFQQNNSVISSESPDSACNIHEVPGSLDETGLISFLTQHPDTHFIGIRSKTEVTEAVLTHPSASKLQAIGCFCIGTNQVDLSAARSRGIVVFNSPFCNSRSVAELVIGYIIGLSRHLGDFNADMHKLHWTKTATGCYEIRGKILGIVGYGHIGSQLSVMAEAMGMKVIYYDIENKLPLGNATSATSLENLLGTADFVSLHVPATDETRGMIAEAELAIMKKRSYLINASRGNVVNLLDLALSLKSQHLAGAAIDVYPVEPKKSPANLFNEYGVDDNTNNYGDIRALMGLKNIILTPHVGGSTQEAQRAIGVDVATKYLDYINCGTTTDAVNFPELSISKSKKITLQTPITSTKQHLARICNIHQNLPGVMKDINTLLANYNIVNQQLGTEEDIGYLLCDLEIGDAKELKSSIQALPSSIRTRIRY